jgi:uncharacterized protein (UPF0333 family)
MKKMTLKQDLNTTRGYFRHMGRKRGQVSMEFFIVIAFTFAVLVPLVYFYFSESQDAVGEVNGAQVVQVARKIVSNAEAVYAFGEPTSITLRVYMPSGVQKIAINGTEITFWMYGNQGLYAFSESFAMNVSGSVGNTTGIHNIKIMAKNESVVINDV